MGCANHEEPEQIKVTQYQAYDFGWICVIEIDTCEYILFKSGSDSGLTHKGNCKYCRELK